MFDFFDHEIVKFRFLFSNTMLLGAVLLKYLSGSMYVFGCEWQVLQGHEINMACFPGAEYLLQGFKENV